MSRKTAQLMAGTLLALALARPAGGQSAFSVHFGENADATATELQTGQTVSLAFAHFAAPGGLSLAVGIPTAAGAGTRWGSATAWIDRPLAARLGLAGAASGFGYHDPVLAASGGGADAKLHAYTELDAGTLRLRLRAGGRAGTFAGGGQTVNRAFGGGGADATVAAGPLLLRGSADLWAASEGTYPEIGAVALFSIPRLLAHARVSRWLHDELPGTGWAVGAELGLTDRLALVAHGARASTDILFFTPPQRSWSVGLRFGHGAPRPAADLPLSVIVAPGQRIRLQLPAHAVHDAAAPVRVAGTFSAWQPLEMRRRGKQWVLELRLEPGVYEFAFVAPDGTWFVPEETPGRKPDGFGGYVGTIVVR